MAEAGVGFGDLAGVAATAGPGLIGGVIVGVDDRQGDRCGPPPAAARDQSPRGPRADGAADRRPGFPVSCCCWCRAATASCWWSKASAATGGSARPSTMRWAKPSTRSPRCWASAIRAGRRSSARVDRRPEALPAAAADAGPAGLPLLVLGPEDRGPAARIERLGPRGPRAASASPISAPASRPPPATSWSIAPATRPGSFAPSIRAAEALVVAGGVAANAHLRARLAGLAAEQGLRLIVAAASALHRQRRDDRLGRAGAAGAGPDR